MAAAAAVLVLAGPTGCGGGADSAEPTAKTTSGQKLKAATPTPSASLPPGIRKLRSVQEVPSVPDPERLRIPALRVDTTLELLGQRADQTIEVPVDWQRAGWYRDGPKPGEPGAAVMLGHVDSPQGSAVFTGLAGLDAGTPIHIDRTDGSTVTFRVTRIEQHRRAEFPTSLVYLPTLERELRLITCGGRYIKSLGGYQSNVVVFATAEPPAQK